MNYMLERLREPSTWRGIVMLVTALGVSLTPDQQSAISKQGLPLSGLSACSRQSHATTKTLPSTCIRKRGINHE